MNRRSFMGLLGIAPAAIAAAPALKSAALPVAVKRMSPILTLVRGAGQCGSSLIVEPLHERVSVGDMFIIMSVVTIRNPAKPAQVHAIFTVTSDADAGSTELPIFPSIIPNTMFQNVNKSPENGQIVRWYFPGMEISL